jgi:hypothetical protein
MRDLVRVIVSLALGAGVAQAADQTILGKQLQGKDAKPGLVSTKRKIVAQAKETASADTIVGDPTTSGATVTVFVSGTGSAIQVFVLPAGTDPRSGKPFWSATGGGFKYKDSKGTNGAVRVAEIKKSGSGTFQIKIVALSKNGPVAVVPPDPGTSGCVRVEVGGGDRYHVLFPAPPNATVKKNDAKSFVVKDAVVEGLCPLPICGNGFVEPGEACDGGPFCANCEQNVTSCCVVPGQCVTTLPYSLFTDLVRHCEVVLPPPPRSNIVRGGVCQPDASCVTESFEPLSVCCQENGSCEDTVVADTGALWSFHQGCQVGGRGGRTAPGARCVGVTCVNP